MFSDLVILYLFLGGAGAGLLVILSTLEALRFVGASSARWISATVWIPSAFFRMAWPVSFVILSMAILALIADLGRPDRLFAFVLHPRLSVMTIGAYALAIALGAFCDSQSRFAARWRVVVRRDTACSVRHWLYQRTYYVRLYRSIAAKLCCGLVLADPFSNHHLCSLLAIVRICACNACFDIYSGTTPNGVFDTFRHECG